MKLYMDNSMWISMECYQNLSLIRLSLTLKIYFKNERFIHLQCCLNSHTHIHTATMQTVFTLYRADHFTHIHLYTHIKFRFCKVRVTPEMEKRITEKNTDINHKGQICTKNLLVENRFHLKTLKKVNRKIKLCKILILHSFETITGFK